jgi:hypothetical protein
MRLAKNDDMYTAFERGDKALCLANNSGKNRINVEDCPDVTQHPFSKRDYF